MVNYKIANRRRLLCLVSSAVLVLGCDADVPTVQDSVGLTAVCSSNAHCANTRFCDPTYRICVSNTQDSHELMLVATPPAKSDAVPAHDPKVTFTPGEALTVDLPRMVKITGSIAVDGNLLDPSSIPATLLAVAVEQLVPGHYRSSSAIADANGFELKLEAGIEYRLSVRADDRSRPTFITTIIAHDDQTLALTLPSKDELPQLSGRIMQAEESMNRPLEGVAVTAVETTSNARCSSVVTNALGTYRLVCPAPGTYVVRVSPAPDGPSVPRFDAVFDGESELRLDTDITLEPLILPLKSRTTSVNIEVNGDAVDASPGLEAVDVCLTSFLEDTAVWTNAVFTVHGTTDQGGDIDLDVMPGEYLLEVLPSTLTSYNATSEQLLVTNNPVSRKVQLSRKPILTGTIRSQEGNAVPRAQVEALMKITDPSTGAVGTRAYSVHADDSGAYELPVDTGIVTLYVLPPEGSALPRWQESDYEVAEDTERDIVLPGAQVVTGLVTSTDTTHLEGIAIELYRRVDDTTTLVARGYSNEGGAFLLILPDT